jgi:hypothetical protein
MHPLIERYLEQVKAQLKRLSVEQRSEEVRELKLHLQALVEEGKERGLNESKAVQAALDQFGSANKVGRDLNRAVLQSAPLSLPKAFSVVTFIMIGQAMWALLTNAYWVMPANWTIIFHTNWTFAQALWLISPSCFYCGISLALAFSLRQLRPWAFWLTLIFLSYKSLRSIIGLWFVVSAVSHAHSVSYFALGILQWVAFFLATLFCLSTLVLNRQAYLRLAGERRRT